MFYFKQFKSLMSAIMDIDPDAQLITDTIIKFTVPGGTSAVAQYVQTIKPDNTIEKLPAEIYDLDNEDNIMFGNYIFLSRKKFEDAYIEALSRLDDAKYFD